MDYETLIENLVYWSKASHVNPRSRYALGKAANAITDLLARAEVAEARAEKAERERDEAVRICAKLITLCSPPKEWVPKLFRRHINRPGDYMGCGYTFLDGFNLIIENFVETADDELYTAIRDATEKEIIERSMRMNGNKEE